ncbi:DUF4277 domain-containing protein [Streptomyces kaempferi]
MGRHARTVDDSQLAGIIDEVCPVGANPFLTHGQVIEAMVSNRLTSAAPLVRMGDRVHTGVVEEGPGVDPGLLNGDHPAWALDAIAPELQRIAGTVEAGAIAEFGIDVGRLHWDVTSTSAHSACPTEGEDANYPVMKYGLPNDRRGISSRSKRGIRRPGIPGTPGSSAAVRALPRTGTTWPPTEGITLLRTRDGA